MNVLIVLTALGVVLMFGGVFRVRQLVLPVAVTGLIGALVLNVMAWNTNCSYFNSMMLMDNYAIAFTGISIVAVILVVLFYHQFNYKDDAYYAEVFSIILFSLAGAEVMYSFTNLLMLFLGLEILSLSFYVLAGVRKRDLLSNEASLKYFLMGAFSTGFLLFGIAMLYGATGSFSLNEINAYCSDVSNHHNTFLVTGILMVMIGLLFKVAAAPFQFWTPDVYQGAPTIVTAYMATVGKVAAFAAFLRLFEASFASVKENYEMLLWGIAVLTLFVGNIIAIYQSSVKRMLAYSSIAHAGYMLIAIVTLNAISNGAILYYSIAYTLASLSAFVIVQIVQQSRNSDHSNAFNDLAKSKPLLSFALAVAMISLAGIPVTAGFFGKFYLFTSAISDGYVWLVVLAVINSIISIFYYFRPVIAAYTSRSHEVKFSVTSSTEILLMVLTIATILFGIFPGWITGIL